MQHYGYTVIPISSYSSQRAQITSPNQYCPPGPQREISQAPQTERKKLLQGKFPAAQAVKETFEAFSNLLWIFFSPQTKAKRL